MINILALFLCIILGTISIIIIFKSRGQKTSPFVNKYLVVLILSPVIRFTFHLILLFNPFTLPDGVKIKVYSLGFVCAPVAYLYFQDLIYQKRYKNWDLGHFIIPSMLVTIIFFSNFTESEYYFFFTKNIILVCVNVMVFFYNILSFLLLYREVWFRKNEISIIQKQNIIIRNWTLLLYGSFSLIFIYKLFTINIYFVKYDYFENLIWVSAMFWSSVFLIFILTPEIQYGFDFLNKKIEEITKKLVLPQLWSSINPTQKITLARDVKLAEKINNQLNQYIHKIEEAAFHSEIFRNQNLTTDDIAAHINIPSSHVNFIFKYHCLETFSDFKKIIRIHDAIKMIENGFLKASTIESLSTKVGFVTYNTFHVAFKSITGLTTQEYIKGVNIEKSNNK